MTLSNCCQSTTSAYARRTQNIAAATDHSSLAQVSYRDAIKQLSKLNEGLLLVPLKAKGRINGILVMGPKSDGEAYLAEEKAFLSDLASLAAIAVENARLYELATVDMMTKLKIHHFFQTRLREEMELARETGQPLALLLTDIDHFKKFNDTYGHQIGDLVLKEVAKVLINIARGKDLAARYGGKSFLSIAPGRDLDTACVSPSTVSASKNCQSKTPVTKGIKYSKSRFLSAWPFLTRKPMRTTSTLSSAPTRRSTRRNTRAAIGSKANSAYQPVCA